MITLIVQSESSHQAELCLLDMLRSPWKSIVPSWRRHDVLPEWRHWCEQGVTGDGNSCWMVRSSTLVWVRSSILSEQFYLNKLDLCILAHLRYLKTHFCKSQGDTGKKLQSMEHKDQGYEINQSTEGNVTHAATKAFKMSSLENPNTLNLSLWSLWGIVSNMIS